MCSFQAEEAEATYRTCIADATTQQQELEDIKVNMLKQIQDVIRQSDQILRAVSLHPAYARFLWGFPHKNKKPLAAMCY